MKQLMSIALGGAMGAVLRFYLSNVLYHLLGRSFPYGTLGVNILGSFLMGFFYVLCIERSILSEDIRALLMVGIFGALTTFSTFSLESILLLEQGEYGKCVINLFLSVVLCLFAVWMGINVGRQV